MLTNDELYLKKVRYFSVNIILNLRRCSNRARIE